MASKKQPPRKVMPGMRVITPWQPTIQQSWSLEQIKQAIRAHMDGDFQQTARMLRSMGEDDEIPGTVRKMCEAVVKSPFSMQPWDEDVQDDPLADAASDVAHEMLPDAEVMPLIADYVLQGVAVGTLDWVTRADQWYPRLRRLDTEYLQYESSARQWWYQAREGRLQVVPGDGRWVLWTAGEYGFQDGLARSLSKLWYFKQRVWRDWMRYNERHGLPIVKAFMPLISEAHEKDQFVTDVRELGSEGVLGLPRETDEFSSYNIELLEPTDQAWETFQAAIDRADRKIQIMLLGANASTELSGEAGSRAASETHASQLDGIRAKAIASSLGEALQNQVMVPWNIVNYPGEPTPPFPLWDTEPPSGRREESLALQSLGLALNMMKLAGWNVTNIEELAEPYGIELEAAPEPAAPEPGPPPPGGGFGLSRFLAAAARAPEAKAAKGVIAQDIQIDDIALAAAGITRTEVDRLLDIVGSSESPSDMVSRLRAAFSAVDPTALADLIESALVLAELNGMAAAKG